MRIRFRDGGYWLHDVSTNGTFVNGAQFRLDAPHLLRNGDRLTIGPYIIAVAVEGQAATVAARPSAAAAHSDVWGAVGEAAAPEDRGAYRVQKPRRPAADFLDFASSVGPAGPAADAFAAPAAAEDWLRAPPPPVAAPGPPPAAAAPDLIARIAAAAGIPERAIAGRDPNALADEIGLALRLTVQNLAQLLSSRANRRR